MKKTLIGIVILVVVVVIGLQLFLAYGLTDSLRQWVLPMAKERWNLDINLTRVSVNLPGGSLCIHGAQVINPPGFDNHHMISMKRFKLNIGLLALFRGGIAEIKKASIQDATLNVVRNREGLLNIGPALAAIHNAISNAPTTTSAVAGPGQPSATPPNVRRIPDFAIRQMQVKTHLHYIDHKLTDPPFNLGLDMQVRLKDITNYGRNDVMSGTINLQGHILTTDRKCAFDLHGRIAPIKDPSQPSFDLTGSIQAFNLSNFKELAMRCGFEQGQISGTMTLYCQQGIFDREKSILHLTFNNIKLTETQRQKYSGIPFPETFKVLVPIAGTLTNPQIDIREGMLKTLASKDTFDTLIRGVMDAQQRSTDTQPGNQAPNTNDTGTGKPNRPADIRNTLGGLFGQPESKSK